MKYNHLIKEPELGIPEHPVGNNIAYNMNFADKAAKILVREYDNCFIRFVCMGSSGAMLAAMVAQNIMKDNTYLSRVLEIIHIKKEGEFSHFSGHSVCKCDGTINIIIDDFICSGKTIDTIYNRFVACNPLEKVDCIIVGGFNIGNSGGFYMKNVSIGKMICSGL